MNVTKLSAIAEIVSSIAIVVTLAYLAIETRQNTAALLSTSRYAALEADLGFLDSQLEYPLLTERVNSPDASPEDIARADIFLVKFLRIREFEWNQYQAGILDAETWESYMRVTSLTFSNDRARRWLDSGVYGGDPEFVAYVQRWLADHDGGR